VPKTWEWGPEAEAMRESYGMERLFGQKQDLAKQQQGYAIANRDVNNAAALERALAVPRQARQFAKEDQDRELPALRALMRGTPEVGQAFGYGPAEGPVAPGAYGPGAPVTREPSDEELRGLAPSLKGMVPTILQKKLEGPQKPMAVSPGQSLVDPRTGQVLFEGAPKPGAYGTYDEAMREAMRQQVLNTASGLPKMRPTIDQDTQGHYQIKWSPAEPVTPQDPIKERYRQRIEEGMSPAKAYDQYLSDLRSSTGARTEGALAVKPIDDQVRNYLMNITDVEKNMEQLRKFTEDEKRAFVGYGKKSAGEWLNAAKEYPWVGSAVRAWGPKVATDKFAEFHALHGPLRTLAFGVGGKQLTALEKSAVEASLPTGEEKSYAEYQAKMKYFQTIMQMHKIAALNLSKMPREMVTPEALEGMWQQAKGQAGLTMDRQDEWKKFMSPDDRLRDKIGR